jgi:hypothetical protein
MDSSVTPLFLTPYSNLLDLPAAVRNLGRETRTIELILGIHLCSLSKECAQWTTLCRILHKVVQWPHKKQLELIHIHRTVSPRHINLAGTTDTSSKHFFRTTDHWPWTWTSADILGNSKRFTLTLTGTFGILIYLQRDSVPVRCTTTKQRKNSSLDRLLHPSRANFWFPPLTGFEKA